MIWRWLVIAALLLAVGASGLSIGLYVSNRDESKDRRDTIRHATGDVIIARCSSENVLRRELRSLVNAGRDNLRAYHRRGLLTDSEYRETLKDQGRALAKLHAIGCAHVRDVFLRTSN